VKNEAACIAANVELLAIDLQAQLAIRGHYRARGHCVAS